MHDQTILWSTYEYEQREHSTDWYWVVGIITIALAIAFFIVDNMLLSIIVLLGIGILLTHTKHEPLMREYEISRKGIRINKTLYRWDSLDSFWILDSHDHPERGTPAKILLTSKKQFMPHIVVPLGELDPEMIRGILLEQIPEEFQVEPIYDRIMRRLGF